VLDLIIDVYPELEHLDEMGNTYQFIQILAMLESRMPRMSCLSGLEGAGRKRTSVTRLRAALRPYAGAFAARFAAISGRNDAPDNQSSFICLPGMM